MDNRYLEKIAATSPGFLTGAKDGYANARSGFGTPSYDGRKIPNADAYTRGQNFGNKVFKNRKALAAAGVGATIGAAGLGALGYARQKAKSE